MEAGMASGYVDHCLVGGGIEGGIEPEAWYEDYSLPWENQSG